MKRAVLAPRLCGLFAFPKRIRRRRSPSRGVGLEKTKVSEVADSERPSCFPAPYFFTLLSAASSDPRDRYPSESEFCFNTILETAAQHLEPARAAAKALDSAIFLNILGNPTAAPGAFAPPIQDRKNLLFTDT
jgi:hypothetical protein